jgi:predicted nucleic acid-binding protein
LVRKRGADGSASFESCRFLQQNPLPLVTTDYVVDEALTLLRARGEGAKAVALGRRLFDLQVVNLIYVTPEFLSRAWELFRDQPARAAQARRTEKEQDRLGWR